MSENKHWIITDTKISIIPKLKVQITKRMTKNLNILRNTQRTNFLDLIVSLSIFEK